jgi:flagellar protein FlgJ
MAGLPGIGDLQGALAIDVQALGALRAQAKTSPDAALVKVASQFEALFMQMMLKSMRDTVSQDGMFDNEATRTYMSMLDQQLATSMSGKSGIGLSDVLVKQLRAAGGLSPAGVAGGADGGTFPAPAGPDSQAPVNPFSPLEGYSTPDAGVPLKQPGAPAHVHGFIDRIGEHALVASRQTGVPARFIAAQAALESNWGRNEIRGADGASSHNLFGIKATSGWSGRTVEVQTTEYVNGTAGKTSEKFRAYGSDSEAFMDYARLLKSRYKEAIAAGSDPVQFAQGLQRAGYATDPNYAEKIARVIQSGFSARA